MEKFITIQFYVKSLNYWVITILRIQILKQFLYAYLKQWGIEALNRLEGMFAIVIYDFISHELFLVRDRIGIKLTLIFFFTKINILSFASEIKALWQLPWNVKESQ